MQSIKINKPCTLYIRFTRANPNTFTLTGERNGLYYFRNLNGKVNRIKFNIPDPDVYTSNHEFELIKICEIEIPSNLPALPKYERNEIKDFVIVDNPSLIGSPARIFAKEGVIERGRKFYDLPKPVRAFIMLHEVGHFFYGITDADRDKAAKMNDMDRKGYLNARLYESEAKCDLFALTQFLSMGYNRSTAYYSLSQILSRSQENINRVKKLIDNIQKTNHGQLT